MTKLLWLIPLLWCVSAFGQTNNCSNTSLSGGWTCVQALGSTQAASTTYSLAYPGSVVSGHVLLAAVAVNSATNTFSSPTDTLTNTWSNCAIISGFGIGVEIFYTVTGSSGADTFSVTNSASTAGRVMVVEYSGNAASSIGESCQSGVTGSGTTCSTSSQVTTSAANDLIPAFVYDGGTFSSVGAGFALRYEWSTNDWIDQDQVGATATSYTVGSTSSGSGCAVAALGLKAGASGPPHNQYPRVQ